MDTTPDEVLSLANTLLSHIGITRQVTSMRQCDFSLFCRLYKALTGSVVSMNQPYPSEAVWCQAVVDELSTHLSPYVSLEHIKGSDLARGDTLSIKNLLDIFSVLFCLPMPAAENTRTPADQAERAFGALLSPPVTPSHNTLSTLSTLSPPSQSASTGTDSTTELLKPVPRAKLPHSLMVHGAANVSPLPTVYRPDVSLSSSVRDTVSTVQSVDHQTTPTQSPGKRNHLLLSPLHHSTPHTSTRSRVFNFNATSVLSSTTPLTRTHAPHPLTLDYGTTPSNRDGNQTDHTHSSLTTPQDPPISIDSTLSSGSSVMPNSSASQNIPDLTITDLHTTHDTLRASVNSPLQAPPDGPQSAVNGDPDRPEHTPPLIPSNELGPRVCFTMSTEQRERAKGLTASSVGTSVDQSSQRAAPALLTTSAADHCIRESSSDTVLSSENSNTVLSRTHNTECVRPSGESSVAPSSSIDDQETRARANVLATLYRNYKKELKHGGKGQISASGENKRSKSTENKKNRRYKGSKYSKTTKQFARHPLEERQDDGSRGERTDRQHSPTQIAVGDNLLPVVEKEFPFVDVSPSVMQGLWQRQIRQTQTLTSTTGAGRANSVIRRVKEFDRRHQSLLSVVKKEMEHTQRMKKVLTDRSQKQAVLNSVRNKRQATARAKRYFNDYELRLKAKLQRKRTREEQIFKRAFEDALDLQRERVREMRRFTKERQEANTKQHHEKLEAMENFYRDQFAMLAESVAAERGNVSIREMAQNKMVQEMKRELRERMEKEIKELQDCLDREEDVVHFRELDQEMLSHKLAHLTFTSAL